MNRNEKTPIEMMDELSPYVSLKKRNVPDSQKQMIFEEIIFGEYRKVLTRKCILWFSSCAATVLMVFGVSKCFFHHNTESSFEALSENVFEGIQMPASTTVMFPSGNVSSKARVARIDMKWDEMVIDCSDTVSFNSMTGNAYLLVPQGRQAMISLVDGTSITLNSGTKIMIPGGYTSLNRTMYLEGEAYFNVTPDPEHPFVVNAGSIVASVKGTQFFINTFPFEHEIGAVALVKGKVDVSSPLLEETVSLEPNQTLTLSGLSYIKTDGIAEQFTCWLPDRFIELDSPLSSVIMRLAEYYGLSAKMNFGAEDMNCHGRLLLSNNPRETFETISAMLPVNCTFVDDKNILITAKK